MVAGSMGSGFASILQRYTELPRRSFLSIASLYFTILYSFQHWHRAIIAFNRSIFWSSTSCALIYWNVIR
jgi:hypothetical protein